MSLGNGGAREYEGCAWSPLNLLLLQDGQTVKLHGGLCALLLPCGGELVLPAALFGRELQPRRVPVGSSLPQAEGRAVCHLGKRWSTGTKRQKKRDRFMLQIQGYVWEMETIQHV